jgi:metallo-beta-lactamase class B
VTEYGREVLPNLYVVSWLGMTPGRADCHVYALRGASGILLVDCGTPWGHERLARNMAHWGLCIADVRTILLTHSHVDHGSGGYLFKRRGAEVLGHREIVTAVECQWETALGKDGDGTAYRLDGYLGDGDRIVRRGFDVEVIATPGHTRGCLSYRIRVDGALCLFTGDLVMTSGLPGWHGDPGFSRPDLIASLRRLQAVEFDHLCHGHDVLLNDRGRVFREALDRCERGEWDALGSPLATPIEGRQPAREGL